MMDCDKWNFLDSLQDILVESRLDVGVILIGCVKGADGIEHDGDGLVDVDLSLQPVKMFGFQEVELSKFLSDLPLTDGPEVTEGVLIEDFFHVFVNAWNRHVGLNVKDISMGINFEIKKSRVAVADRQRHPQCKESFSAFGISVDEETAFNREELFNQPRLFGNLQRHKLRDTQCQYDSFRNTKLTTTYTCLIPKCLIKGQFCQAQNSP